VRLWLVGAVSVVLVACVVAAVAYFRGTESEPPETSASGVGGAALEPAPPAPRTTARLTDTSLGRDRDDLLHPSSAPAYEASMPVQAAGESSVEEDNAAPEFDPSALRDPARLRVYLSGGDPVLAEAVLQAASRRDRQIAAQAVLDIVRDGTEPRRLDVLQRLCASPYIDAETRNAALQTALQDPDAALVTHAIQELSDRSDATAISLLSEALDHGELSTRLLIVQSLASNSAAEPLLRQGLKDPDETVRNTAQAVLSLRSRPNDGTNGSL
jgi:hypothetical protein